MTLIADFHIHSHYSRATAKQMNAQDLYRWGKIKGINIIGTGDFTHPKYFSELREILEPAEPGLFRLREDLAIEQDKALPQSVRDETLRFCLTVEISNIYSRNEKVRKVHNLILIPSFEAALSISAKLEKIGNIHSDGRPILGLDSQELLRITLDSDPYSQFIPAHIWTPWFSMFGSRSGFDSIEEAFGELSDKIVAIETGLSSDPYMNWRLKELQDLTILSNSDAHSPQKLGREANILDCKLDYFDIIQTIRTNDKRMVGTIEFFPQEGKYHWDGHRECGICFAPSETIKHNGMCPICAKPVVIGVENRVNVLADMPENYKHPSTKIVDYIVPLAEILTEIFGVKSPNAKRVIEIYDRLIARFGNEFKILRSVDFKEIQEEGYTDLAKGLYNMRKGDVSITPGFDGVFGRIKVVNHNTRLSQKSMF